MGGEGEGEGEGVGEGEGEGEGEGDASMIFSAVFLPDSKKARPSMANSPAM